MENFRNDKKEQEIVFSKSVKAGKRIYYLDVKRSRNNDLFLAITESKKKTTGFENGVNTYEKHKIFLYKEDFDKFTVALGEIIEFINENNKLNGSMPINQPRYNENEEVESVENSEEEAAPETKSKYDFDVDFEI